MTDGVSRRRVSHLCSLVRLGTRSREGINSLGISINFVPRLVCGGPSTKAKTEFGGYLCGGGVLSLPPLCPPCEIRSRTNRNVDPRHGPSLPPSPVIITGGVRGRLDLRRCANSANLRLTTGWKNGGEWIPYQRRRAIKRDD